MYLENSEFCSKETVDLIRLVAIFFSVPEKSFRDQLGVSCHKFEFLPSVLERLVYSLQQQKAL